jgi:hypothetical protein
MALADELDRTIRAAQERVEDLEVQLEALRRDLARQRQIRADALRLYTSSTGRQHPLGESSHEDARDRPRAEQVLAALEAADGPVTLSDLVAAMPDGPERGAVSAVVHRAIAKGDVRRLKRGVYELADSYPRAG